MSSALSFQPCQWAVSNFCATSSVTAFPVSCTKHAGFILLVQLPAIQQRAGLLLSTESLRLVVGIHSFLCMFLSYLERRGWLVSVLIALRGSRRAVAEWSKALCTSRPVELGLYCLCRAQAYGPAIHFCILLQELLALAEVGTDRSQELESRKMINGKKGFLGGLKCVGEKLLGEDGTNWCWQETGDGTGGDQTPASRSWAVPVCSGTANDSSSWHVAEVPCTYEKGFF